jgi:predicted small lipoprotein YifL
MKKVLCLVVALCLVLSLVACGQRSNADVVSAALSKNNAAKSMSFTTDVKGDFTLEGLDDLLTLAGLPGDQLETMLNQMKIAIEGRVISGDKKDQAQTELGISIGIMGMKVETKTWTHFLDDGKPWKQL